MEAKMKNMDVFDRFCKVAPFAVMAQSLIRSFICEEFEELFDANRNGQYEDKVTFEALGLAVADIALGHCDNANQAYREHKENLAVARSSFYDKLNGTRTSLSEAVVAKSASKAIEIQDALGFVQWDGFPGHRVFALDGNHLQKTEKRIEELRGTSKAPLPGTSVARFDLGRQLFDRMYLLEDAHQQESATLDDVAQDLGRHDLLMADRHYCVAPFLTQLDKQSSAFIIRQHGRLKGELLGRRRKIGRTETGMVYEQSMRLTKDSGAITVRRITIELDEPTRDGDTEIHVLSNLPSRVNAKKIIRLYARRWEVETAFYHEQMCLNGELPSLGHPRAALFLFCIATMAYNILQTLFSVLYTEHEEEEVNELSFYYISVEIERYTPGMLAILEADDWARIIPRTPKRQAQFLAKIAQGIDLRKYRKSRRGPKKPYKRKSNERSGHLSTAKILGIVPS
jgi:hypothetical protein